jgi:hypothetical protein
MFDLNEATFQVAYSELSKAELAEIIGLFSGNLIAESTILVSMIFAYAISAYLVGNRISKGQSIFLALTYSAFLLLNTFYYFNMYSQIVYLGSMFYGTPANYFFVQLNTFLLIVAWIGSIVYMYQRSRQGDA